MAPEAAVCRNVSSFSGHLHASLDKIHVDVTTQLHAVLELLLIVGLGALRLNVLLDSINLALVVDQLLLDVIQSVVDVRLQNLVLLRVVLHLMVSYLFVETDTIHVEETLDESKAHLLLFELILQIVCLREFIRHLVLHLLNF